MAKRKRAAAREVMRIPVSGFRAKTRFRDRVTDRIYDAGDPYQPTSADRANELLEGGWIVAVLVPEQGEGSAENE